MQYSCLCHICPILPIYLSYTLPVVSMLKCLFHEAVFHYFQLDTSYSTAELSQLSAGDYNSPKSRSLPKSPPLNSLSFPSIPSFYFYYSVILLFCYFTIIIPTNTFFLPLLLQRVFLLCAILSSLKNVSSSPFYIFTFIFLVC